MFAEASVDGSVGSPIDTGSLMLIFPVRLAPVRYDFTARCFNAETGECLCIYKGHLSFVFTLRVCAEVMADEVTDSGDQAVKWFLYTGSVPVPLPPHRVCPPCQNLSTISSAAPGLHLCQNCTCSPPSSAVFLLQCYLAECTY